MTKVGFKHSEETKKRMSASHIGLNTWIKGRKLTEEHKLAIKIGNLGKKISEETRAKMRIAAVKRNPAQWILGSKRPDMIMRMSGENNPRWIKDRGLVKVSDDRQTDPLHKIWRNEVYKRDRYKCRINNQDCKGRLEAHHILDWENYPELRYDKNNGITLCLAHHPRGRAKEQLFVPTFQELISQVD